MLLNQEIPNGFDCQKSFYCIESVLTNMKIGIKKKYRKKIFF